MKVIGVVGLGYVGINIAYYASKKYKVIGYDINKEKIDNYKNGIDVTCEVGNKICESSIEFSSNAILLNKCDIIIICVPTPARNGKPDLRYLIDSTKEVSRNIKKGAIIVYESTVAPGTTKGICKKIFEKNNLKYNEDFYLAYSPERVNPQDDKNKIYNICKIVACENENILNILNNFYSDITSNVYSINSIEIAEAAKLIENTQRDINIAFMNEISEYLEKKGISSKSVFEAMKTKWNCLDFTPGLVGGHCIGVDPYYLLDDAHKKGLSMNIVRCARDINEKVIDRIIDKAKNFSNIGILGFTYKKNCNDIRNTKCGDLYNKLIDNGHNVKVSDCYADKVMVKKEYNIELVDDLIDIDFLIVATNHDVYSTLAESQIKKMFGVNNIVIYDVYSILKRYEGMEIYSL